MNRDAVVSGNFCGFLLSLILLALLLPAGPVSGAEPVEILAEETVLAVVTHKGGFAAGLAHDHLIAAGEYTAVLALDPTDPLELNRARFTLEAPVAALRVDEDPLRERTFPRLKALGILEQPFEELSEKDRGKITKAMVGKSQLDGKAHPAIELRLLSVVREETTLGDETFPWSAQVALTVRGKVVEKAIAVRVERVAERWILEGVGTFRFTEFDIKPYSAALGAVKNQDVFHLYARIVARPGGR